MKKRKIIIPFIIILLIYVLSKIQYAEYVNNLEKWDCTVVCVKELDNDSYVITYSDEKIISTTGTLSFQNKNNFDIVIHLLTDGQEEMIYEIPAGGVLIQYQIIKDVEYTVGCHADVSEGMEIKLKVYDGEIEGSRE